MEKDTLLENIKSLDNDLRLLSMPTLHEMSEKRHPSQSTSWVSWKWTGQNSSFRIYQTPVFRYQGRRNNRAWTNINSGTRRRNLARYQSCKKQAKRKTSRSMSPINQQIDRKQNKGLISPSSGKWTSWVVLVRKKDGNWRFPVDHPKLNASIVEQSMAISSIDSATEIMHEHKYISVRSIYTRVSSKLP